jgi:DNA-directed RNA polymerase subunit omega
MARVTVEDCLDKVENRFALVLLVAKRSKQLLKGASATVSGRNKYIVTSFCEVAAGSVRFEEVAGEDQIAQVEQDLNR